MKTHGVNDKHGMFVNNHIAGNLILCEAIRTDVMAVLAREKICKSSSDWMGV